MFYCGTSGFSYDDWIGIYYPAGLPRKNWLSCYAQEFNALELNSTYYALPAVSAMESLARKTGGGFLFSLKANREMTHTREHAEDACKSFIRMLQPLIEAKKLMYPGAVSLQLQLYRRQPNLSGEVERLDG